MTSIICHYIDAFGAKQLKANSNDSLEASLPIMQQPGSASTKPNLCRRYCFQQNSASGIAAGEW